MFHHHLPPATHLPPSLRSVPPNHTPAAFDPHAATPAPRYPTAPLSLLANDEIDLAVKDESMFVFSKEVVPDSKVIYTEFWDRQDIYALGPQDWIDAMEELKRYRKMIVRSLAHVHRNVRHGSDSIRPVTSAKQLSPTNTYIMLTGWYKMQCVVVLPEHTIADLKAYLHDKNGAQCLLTCQGVGSSFHTTFLCVAGARMPLECLDIGLRSGDDIKIIDDALTVQDVYVGGPL